MYYFEIKNYTEARKLIASELERSSKSTKFLKLAGDLEFYDDKPSKSIPFYESYLAEIEEDNK